MKTVERARGVQSFIGGSKRVYVGETVNALFDRVSFTSSAFVFQDGGMKCCCYSCPSNCRYDCISLSIFCCVMVGIIIIMVDIL